MHDLIVRGGTVVDGTGEPAVAADVAVDDGRITRGRPHRRRRRRGDRRQRPARHPRLRRRAHALRRPGHVGPDCSTPSSWHGVTTVVMGNCGVGFAPARPDQPRLAHRPHGRRRGHPRRRARRGHPLGLGDVPRVPRRPRRQPLRDRRRHPGAARRRARLRDGGARRAQRARHARRHRGDGRDRPGGHRGRRARRVDVANHRSPRHRRRARARHVRRRGRAVRARAGARRGRCRCVRARTGGRARRGPRRRRSRDGLDAPTRGRDRPPGDVRADPARPGPRPVAADARPRSSRTTTAAPPSGPRSRAARSACCSASQTFHPLRDRPSYQAIDGLPLDEKVARLRDPAVRAAHPGGVAATLRRHGVHRSRARPDVHDGRPARLRAATRREHRGARRARGPGPDRSPLRPAARTTTAGSCCCAAARLQPVHSRSDPRDGDCTRRPRSGSATAARTAAPSATPASRPTC